MSSPHRNPPLTRRRLLTITAAASGLALVPIRPAHCAPGISEDPERKLRIWRGVALGADASLQIHHHDAAEADRLIECCLAEVARLEAMFSLYRQD